MGRESAGPAAGVVNGLALGPNGCARRIARGVGPQRHAEEHYKCHESQGAQVELATAVFELHAGADDGRATRQAIGKDGRDQSVVSRCERLYLGTSMPDEQSVTGGVAAYRHTQ